MLAAALALPVAAGAAADDALAAVGDLDPAERTGLVVLDAQDEARAPRQVTRRLLLPLARDLGVKVLAGTRPGRDDELFLAFSERTFGWFVLHRRLVRDLELPRSRGNSYYPEAVVIPSRRGCAR